MHPLALLMIFILTPFSGYVSTQQVQDFEITLYPERLEILPGEIATFDAIIKVSGSTSETFKIEVTGVPPYTFHELRPSIGKFQLKIYTSGDTPPGEYDIRVKATLGEISKSAEARLIVKEGAIEPGFDLRLNTTVIQIYPGETASFSVVVVPYGGFSEKVSLTVSGIPPYSYHTIEGVGAEISVRVITSKETPTGRYNLTVTASGGGEVKRSQVILIVGGIGTTTKKEGSISVSIIPSLLRLKQGEKGSISVRVYREGEFDEPVIIVVKGLPEGSQAKADVNNTSPDFVSSVSVSVSSETPPGSYGLILEIKGGRVRLERYVSLEVIPKETQSNQPTSVTTESGPIEVSETYREEEGALSDFSLEVLPQSISLQRGGRGSVAVTLKHASFNLGEVRLSIIGPEDLSFEFHPKDTLRPGETVSLILTAPGSPGKYSVVVKGVSGNLERSVLLTVEVEEGGSRCFIATASFGENSEVLERLRDFRDYYVMSTYAGSRFLYAFNAFYYLWSPMVAEIIRGNPVLASATRLSLMPLLGALEVSRTASQLSVGRELSVVTAGTITSLLLGSIYFSPFSLLLMKFVRTEHLKVAALIFLASLLGTFLSVTMLLSELASISTSLLVISSISIPPISIALGMRGAVNFSSRVIRIYLRRASSASSPSSHTI